MKKKVIIGVAVVAIVTAAFFVFGGGAKAEESNVFVTAKKGDFVTEITVSGELEAKNSVLIMGPSRLRSARLWQVQIADLVPEGTEVEKGDYVARLDNSELLTRLTSEEVELQQRESAYIQTQLDTALQMRQLRDELINLDFAVEEQELIVEQSQFEPPATIKQEEINLTKAIRTLEQAKINYKLSERKAVAQMQEAASRLTEDRNEVQFLRDLVGSFEIMAPEAGMVIYLRERNGTKRIKGSNIHIGDLTVATLPDLTTMLSRTFVNEVDIRKIKVGQPANVGLDAFPEKRLTGRVISKANVGEQRPNSDAKVFEVSIEINETDTTLRPAMTTSNSILASVVKDVVFLPLECLHSQGDSLTYVFKRDGLTTVKQEVLVGQTNANEAVIQHGIEPGDNVHLSMPVKPEEKALVRLAAGTAQISASK